MDLQGTTVGLLGRKKSSLGAELVIEPRKILNVKKQSLRLKNVKISSLNIALLLISVSAFPCTQVTVDYLEIADFLIVM